MFRTRSWTRDLTLPVPVALLGAAICLLVGALIGFVVAPDSSDRATATVASFNPSTAHLCLSGSSVRSHSDLDSAGQLCGVWRRSGVGSAPHVGQTFRYAVVQTSGTVDGQLHHQTVIYGDSVK